MAPSSQNSSFLSRLPPVTSGPGPASSMSTTITKFYQYPSRSRDGGPRLYDILNYSDRALEAKHDYIQWLFPLPERSAFNTTAPCIDAETAAAFRGSYALRQELKTALVRMLAFYGFSYAGRVIEKNPATWGVNSRCWFVRSNHNHLRITRIIRCLRVLGCEDEANVFYRAVMHEVDCVSDGKRPGKLSVMYWKRAATRPLEVPPEDDDYDDAAAEAVKDDPFDDMEDYSEENDEDYSEENNEDYSEENDEDYETDPEDDGEDSEDNESDDGEEELASIDEDEIADLSTDSNVMKSFVHKLTPANY